MTTKGSLKWSVVLQLIGGILIIGCALLFFLLLRLYKYELIVLLYKCALTKRESNSKRMR